jgi:hypothetical protein
MSVSMDDIIEFKYIINRYSYLTKKIENKRYNSNYEKNSVIVEKQNLGNLLEKISSDVKEYLQIYGYSENSEEIIDNDSDSNPNDVDFDDINIDDINIDDFYGGNNYFQNNSDEHKMRILFGDKYLPTNNKANDFPGISRFANISNMNNTKNNENSSEDEGNSVCSTECIKEITDFMESEINEYKNKSIPHNIGFVKKYRLTEKMNKQNNMLTDSNDE